MTRRRQSSPGSVARAAARRSTMLSPFRDLSLAPPRACPLCRRRRPLPRTPPPHW
uniref:Predicted protein n=1 Tax=Hordeum vulgare subsp. vulgare TaxID=112509 RepID=F2E3G4_HORVV|nr:predicted protein [Hordeum vulgare subsp. vulgare]